MDQLINRTILLIYFVLFYTIVWSQSGTIANGDLKYEIIGDKVVFEPASNAYIESIRPHGRNGGLITITEYGKGQGYSIVNYQDGKFEMDIQEHKEKFKSNIWQLLFRFRTTKGKLYYYTGVGLLARNARDFEKDVSEYPKIEFDKINRSFLK